MTREELDKEWEKLDRKYEMLIDQHTAAIWGGVAVLTLALLVVFGAVLFS